MAVESMGNSSEEVSMIVESEREAMLGDWDRMTGDAGVVSVSGLDNSSGRGGGLSSPLGNPRSCTRGYNRLFLVRVSC